MPSVLAVLVLLLSLSPADSRRPPTTTASSFTYVTARSCTLIPPPHIPPAVHVRWHALDPPESVHDALAVGDGLKSVQPYPKDCLTGTCEWYLSTHSTLSLGWRPNKMMIS
jgi:hypothetical protein